MKKSVSGFTAIEALIIIVIVVGVGFAGYKVFSHGKDTPKQASQAPAKTTDNNTPAKQEAVFWNYNEQTNEYFTQTGTATTCKDPYRFDYSPIDVSQATSIMMPGQYRGFNYKPHGGFRLDNSADGKIDVKLPVDATLVGLTRYLEGDQNVLQYLVTFQTDCGIAFRFDHLATLTPDFQAIADKTPPATTSTMSNPNDAPPPAPFKAGTVVATSIGHPETKNFGFDFGVYDYRHPNAISENPTWAALHEQYRAQDWFGVCWFDMLPGADAQTVSTLSLKVVNPQRPNIISDYCANAPHRTLEYNNGKPTDG